MTSTATSTVEYARLQGKAVSCVLYKPHVTIGRSTEDADVGLKHSSVASPVHVHIMFDSNVGHWLLYCTSHHGAYVDGLFIAYGAAPVPLYSPAFIQLGTVAFYFVLPTSACAGQEPPFETYGLESALYRNSRHRMMILKLHNPADPNTDSSTVGISGSLKSMCGDSNTPVKFRKWKRGGREKFKQSLLTWGLGRWQKIWEEVNEPERTVEELQLFTLTMLRHLQRELQNDHSEDAEPILRGLEMLISRISKSIGFFPEICSDAALSEWVTLKKYAKKWAARLVLLFNLKLTIDKYGLEHTLEGLDLPSAPKTLPVWGFKFDKDLVAGVFTHGYGNFDELLSDKKLCFHSSYRLSTDETRSETHSVWPMHLSLVGRLKKVLDLARARDELLEGELGVPKRRLKLSGGSIVQQEKRQKKSSNDDSRIRKLKAQRQRRDRIRNEKLLTSKDQFTKKDSQFFIRSVLQHGRPTSWDTFKESWPVLLFKNNDILETLYAKLIASANDALGSESPIVYDTPIHIIREPNHERLSDMSIGAPLKSKAAAQFRDRYRLSEKITELVRDDTGQLRSRASILTRSLILPEWWSAECDADILYGCARHGFCNWLTMFKDDELCFVKLLVGSRSMPEESLVLTRVLDIITIVESPMDLESLRSSGDALIDPTKTPLPPLSGTTQHTRTVKSPGVSEGVAIEYDVASDGEDDEDDDGSDDTSSRSSSAEDDDNANDSE